MLARQMDHVIGEIKRDLVERKIRELDVLGIDDIVVAVAADERCCPVLADFQRPDLELFGRNALLVTL